MIRLIIFTCLASGLLASALADEEVPVTCGSVVKLKHATSEYDLHSHEISYGSGSGQQSVTGYKDTSDAASLWAVKGAKISREISGGMLVQDGDCAQGTPIKSGTPIRLQHMNTRRWLHSHKFPSPLSGNQEVSAFGDDSVSDHLDVWEVSFTGGQWMRDQKVKLKHVETGAYLSSSPEKRYGRPISGQLEICGKTKAGKNEQWIATEGVFFPKAAEL